MAWDVHPPVGVNTNSTYRKSGLTPTAVGSSGRCSGRASRCCAPISGASSAITSRPAEVFQEVSVQILAGQGPAEPDRFAAWSRGVARHVISHQWRMRRRALAQMPLEGELMDEISNAFADPEGHLDARVWMARVMGDIDTDGLELLYRRYVLEETGKELADELSQSPAAVRMRLMRLRTAVSAHAPGRSLSFPSPCTLTCTCTCSRTWSTQTARARRETRTRHVSAHVDAGPHGIVTLAILPEPSRSTTACRRRPW